MTGEAPRWQKLGQIFDPTEHKLPIGCESFAQSPQALLCDDFVRIFFSTRARDGETGKFLSHIAYVDFDWELKQVLRVVDHSVIQLGQRGTFDEHGIFPINPLRVGDKVFAYTCGWSRRTAVSVETGIGLAMSNDNGVSFQRIGPGPILSSTLHEPCLVGDGFVQRFGDTFHMWYIYGHPWKQFPGQTEPDRIYKIAHATSRDGIHWTKTGGQPLVADAIGEDECQALPSVVSYCGRYHMYFCYRYPNDFRNNPERAYRIGHAYSDDLSSWVRADDPSGLSCSGRSDQWDGLMMCYPHAFHHDGRLFLLYNGNDFGRRGFGIAVAQ